jgi:acyl-CoA reductase-like NAD-dependent aldehyde dehydrogenase
MEVRRIPYGVVAAVTPWNAPIILSMLKVGPALATGNTIVVKPSPLAPLAVTRVLHAIAGALPDGVLAVVHGDAEAGSALVGHPLVAKIAFTGGLGVGSAIARQAADRVVPTVLELGGNDAAILLEDADLDDLAIERLVQASFITTGQVCMAAKRLYVHRSRVDEVVDRYRTVADRVLVTGDPLADGTTLGPLVTAAARDRVAALVDGARAAGADVVPLGRVADPDLVAGGWYLDPTLVLGADDHAPIVADEQFGPTVPLLAFDDEDDVVARANASEVGLASSVWSADEDRAFALARRLEAGMTFINTHNRSGMALRAPFGGVKRSGYGREYGDAGITEYLQTHTINAPAAFRPGGAGGGAGYPT